MQITKKLYPETNIMINVELKDWRKLKLKIDQNLKDVFTYISNIRRRVDKYLNPPNITDQFVDLKSFMEWLNPEKNRNQLEFNKLTYWDVELQDNSEITINLIWTRWDEIDQKRVIRSWLMFSDTIDTIYERISSDNPMLKIYGYKITDIVGTKWSLLYKD